MIVLSKVVSGGQDGVDQAGLRAARRAGLATGGWAPRGWRTSFGPAPWLADYGLVEHPGGYGARTDANARMADATVRLARNFFSFGEQRTLKAIGKKPRIDLRVTFDLTDEGAARLRRFLADNRVRVLNVAGNSEKTAPGIGALVEEFLFRVLATADLSI